MARTCAGGPSSQRSARRHRCSLVGPTAGPNRMVRSKSRSSFSSAFERVLHLGGGAVAVGGEAVAAGGEAASAEAEAAAGERVSISTAARAKSAATSTFDWEKRAGIVPAAPGESAEVRGLLAFPVPPGDAPGDVRLPAEGEAEGRPRVLGMTVDCGGVRLVSGGFPNMGEKLRS